MLKLMIVDDEPIISAGIRDMVEKENTAFTKITTARDGIEALQVMDYFLPDVIITDIQMPEMDGLSFIREARERRVSRFIILSGYDVFEYAQQAVRLQVVEYLLKPINERDLIQLLKQMSLEVMEERQQQDRERDDARNERAREALPDDRDEALSEHVKMLKAYIHNNYMKAISLSDAADYLNLHPAYIGQLFKKDTGDSFTFYTNQFRIAKAKELLVSSPGLSLDKIAGCIGFENRRTFYKVFRKFVGQTPGEYRNNSERG